MIADAQTSLLLIVPTFNSLLQRTNGEYLKKCKRGKKICLKPSNIKPFRFFLHCHPPREAHLPSVTLGAHLRAPKQPEILVR